MKKNRTMRLAALLLVLTLITSCFVGGTFAKYTASVTGNDEARVAYWGFDQDPAEVTLEGLFSDVDANVSGNANGLLAPGTKGAKTFAFGYTDGKTGTTAITAPEVAYTFTVDVKVEGSETAATVDTDALDDNENFSWTLKKNGAAVKVDGVSELKDSYQTVAELEAALERLAGKSATNGVAEYAANVLPDFFTSADEVYEIGWEWVFETAGAGMTAQDKTDTDMGNAQDLDDLKITISISAIQKN